LKKNSQKVATEKLSTDLKVVALYQQPSVRGAADGQATSRATGE